jgi:hypothetical protein
MWQNATHTRAIALSWLSAGPRDAPGHRFCRGAGTTEISMGREGMKAMTSMLVQPQFVSTAAADVADIGSVIGAAKAAAAGPTTSVVAAAEDEVSAITAALFGSYGQEYQALLHQAAKFHEQFAAALAGAQAAYIEAETAAISLLGGSTAAASPVASLDPPLPGLTGPTIGLFMGGAGLPIPTSRPGYMQGVLNWVNFSGIPNLTLNQALPLFTPEGFYPITGIKVLPVTTSVNEGVTILESSINQQLFPAPGTGTPQGSVAVLGLSESSIISSLVMQDILNGTYPFQVPLPSQLNFTLLGNQMTPNGGIFERFVGLTLPSLGYDFYGATPPNTLYGTSNYTLEYDGFADFPQYPINFLSDLNAFAGIYYVHGTYASIDPAHLPPGDQIITLPGSAALGGSNAAPATNYYMITQPNLPLLNPLRAIPVIGNPIADLLQPDLTYLVNWGYGDPSFGYSTGPANVPTPFGVIPPLSDTLALPGDLAVGTQQGIGAFVSDISAGVPALASNLSPAGLASLGSAATGGASSLPAALMSAQVTPTSIIESLQMANTNITNFISNAAAQSYAVLLPTADIVNALVTSIPAYDANLFLTGIGQALNGDPVNGLIYAFGAPLAANTALYTLAAGFEVEVIVNAVTAII